MTDDLFPPFTLEAFEPHFGQVSFTERNFLPHLPHRYIFLLLISDP